MILFTLDEEGNPTDEDDITVKQLFQNFEEYCLPRKNLVVERRKLFWKNQHDDETFDQDMTELKNLASTCDQQSCGWCQIEECSRCSTKKGSKDDTCKSNQHLLH